MSKLTLIGSRTCPDVQSVTIALNEKRIVGTFVPVDVADQPDWFADIAPLGRGPLLRIEGRSGPPTVLFGSAAILEYIEDVLPGERLHPADPVRRAQHRGWLAFAGEVLDALGRFGGASDAATLDLARGALRARFKRLESTLVEGGPYFAGQRFSLVDAAFAPVFRQVDALETAAATGLLDGFPGLERWRRSLAARDSVRAAMPDDGAELHLGRLRRIDPATLNAA